MSTDPKLIFSHLFGLPEAKNEISQLSADNDLNMGRPTILNRLNPDLVVHLFGTMRLCFASKVCHSFALSSGEIV